MYNNAQVIIDLDEYNELKKKVAAFEAGNESNREDHLIKTIVRLATQLRDKGFSANLHMEGNFAWEVDDTINPPKIKLIELNK